MSFFDEPDEPAAARRPAPGRRAPAAHGRRPTRDRQTIIERRAVAVAALVILVVLLAMGIHSCDVSALDSSLTHYDTSVASLIQASDKGGSQVFFELEVRPGLEVEM